MLRVHNEEVTTNIIDGDATLINLTTRVYYALDGLGAVIWSELVKGTTRERLIAKIGPRAGTAEAAFTADLDRLLEALRAEELIEEVAGIFEVEDEDLLPLPENYSPPTLQRFDDLRDHLALDPPLPLPKSLSL